MEQKKKNQNKESRKLRIEKIKNIVIMVSKAGRKASYKKVIAEFCLEEGTSRRITKEYLDLLIDSGQIKLEGDELTPK